MSGGASSCVFIVVVWCFLLLLMYGVVLVLLIAVVVVSRLVCDVCLCRCQRLLFAAVTGAVVARCWALFVGA